ncbi:MAG: hypothetical protein IPP42_17440 [Saprospiraceae bacterium]|nr:hypothetical protein [Saprospiraceae bacterium]
MISGRNGTDLDVHHGDSGSVWLLETQDENIDKLQPIALHWGQHHFTQNLKNEKFAYSLSTCLSNICRELDVELVRGWNIDSDFSWGETGHYTIGNRAIYCIDKNKFPKLAQLMGNNAENISYTDAAIGSKTYNKSTDNFTPLVDVPDVVFKSKVAGISRFPSENPNHYADVDLTNNGGKTLLYLSKKDENFTVEFWQSFYDELGLKADRQRGLLPFRVKQIFREMVNYLKNGDEAGFVCAAGVLGHYIGDSCQPLHGSKYSDGDGIRTETKGVHSAYETAMIDQNRQEILHDLKSKIDAQNISNHSYNKIEDIQNEDDAAKACLKLMEISMKRIDPMKLNDAYYDAKLSTSSKALISKTLWDKFGDETKETIARGSRYLAKIWEGAWSVAQAENNNEIKFTKISKPKLKGIYDDKNSFLKSYTLDTIGAYFNADNII